MKETWPARSVRVDSTPKISEHFSTLLETSGQSFEVVKPPFRGFWDLLE